MRQDLEEKYGIFSIVFHDDDIEDLGTCLKWCLNPGSWGTTAVGPSMIPQPRPSTIAVTTVVWRGHETIVLARELVPSAEALEYIEANNADGPDEELANPPEKWWSRS